MTNKLFDLVVLDNLPILVFDICRFLTVENSVFDQLVGGLLPHIDESFQVRDIHRWEGDLVALLWDELDYVVLVLLFQVAEYVLGVDVDVAGGPEL